MGKPGSLFSARDRDAMATLHTHCACDGCLTANRHLQGDHVIPRSHGGDTSMGNHVPDCGPHNRWLYNHGYHLERDTNGRWTTTRPDGTRLRPPPPTWPPT